MSSIACNSVPLMHFNCQEIVTPVKPTALSIVQKDYNAAQFSIGDYYTAPAEKIVFFL